MVYDALVVSAHIINYSNERGYCISNLKLQKILYFIQAFFLMEKDQICFYDKIEAWNFGPVIPKVYDEYKKFGSTNLLETTKYWDSNRGEYIPFKDSMIKKKDLGMIDEIVELFAHTSVPLLVSITQGQKPWSENYIPYKRNEIPVKALREYFKTRK